MNTVKKIWNTNTNKSGWKVILEKEDKNII